MASPFVKTAECYITQDGQVNIAYSQLMPIVRVKANNGTDYYIDDKCSIMPNSHYTSDLIIATGNINQWYARILTSLYLVQIAHGESTILEEPDSTNQRPQPTSASSSCPEWATILYIIGLAAHEAKTPSRERQKQIADFTQSQDWTRLKKFYQATDSPRQDGTATRTSIVEFDNQIICKT